MQKPPKTEENDKIHTMHQRAHIKRANAHILQDIDSNNVRFHSLDSKAIVKPEGSVGLEAKAYQPTDESKAGKLYKYDFSIPSVHIDPGSHRFQDKHWERVGDEDKLIVTDDRSVCVFRPKHYVGASGTVWASEDRFLRQEMPTIYEDCTVPTDYTEQFRGMVSIFSDKLVHFVDSTMDEDIGKVTAQDKCSFRKYELNRLEGVLNQMRKGAAHFASDGQLMSETERALYHELEQKINTFQDNVLALKINLELCDITDIKVRYHDLVSAATEIVDTIGHYGVPQLRPRVLEESDAGPGVGVSNHQVQFRAAEKVRVEDSDYYLRIHRASGDCQNPVERTQAAVGKAMSNGSHLHWEHYKRFEDLSEERIKEMSIDDFDEYENDRMKKNVMYVCNDLSYRIQDAPGPRGSMDLMTGYPCQPQSDFFFNDSDYLSEYLKASAQKRPLLPGHAYYSKILAFFDVHFQKGELYLEYKKCAAGTDCEFCSTHPWKSPELGWCPRPYPSPDGKTYLKYSDTPNVNREVDDFHPRAQLKKLFGESSIASTNADDVQAFAEKYCVQSDLVMQELLHMELMQLRAKKRKAKADQQKVIDGHKSFENYPWEQLYKDKKIPSLKVHELDLFLGHYSLTVEGKIYKPQKVALVEAELAKQLAGKICYNIARTHRDTNSEPDTESGSESEEEEEQIMNDDTDTTDDEDEDNDEVYSTEEHMDITDYEDEVIEMPSYSRTGRKQGNWKTRRFFSE